MKNVLIITESISYGGLNLAAIRFQQAIDKDEFQFSYCVRRNKIGELEEKIINQGIPVFHVPDDKLNYVKSYFYYKNLFSENSFDIVHCHLPFFSGIVLFAAMQCGIKKRVAHAHFSQPYTDVEIYSIAKQIFAKFYRLVMRLFLKLFCNVKIACSKESGEFLFGKKEFAKNGIIINNGIETRKYSYDECIRKTVRKELNINIDATVIGHIGQMYSVKNQMFLIELFRLYSKTNSNSHLLLIGDGSDRDILEKTAQESGLDNYIHFLGLRNDVNRLYQAMDIFVFPSLHEGFPLTLIEAQASKLPCLISDTVTKSTKINENVDFANLNDSLSVWIGKMNILLSLRRSSIDISKLVEEFDVKRIKHKIEEIYLK